MAERRITSSLELVVAGQGWRAYVCCVPKLRMAWTWAVSYYCLCVTYKNPPTRVGWVGGRPARPFAA